MQEAQKHIAAAKKDIKLTSKELNQQLADMEELLNINLRRAERENSTVYLQRVPNIADLPPIQPFPVAKCASKTLQYGMPATLHLPVLSAKQWMAYSALGMSN